MTQNESDSTVVLRTDEATVTKWFRLLIVAEWVLIFSEVWVYFAFEASLPSELKTFLAVEPPLTFIMGPLGLAAFLGLLVASIGLWAFRAWARPLFVASSLLLVLLDIPYPSVENGPSSALDTLSTLIAGLVIGIAYFGGIHKFEEERGAAREAPQSGMSWVGPSKRVRGAIVAMLVVLVLVGAFVFGTVYGFFEGVQNSRWTSNVIRGPIVRSQIARLEKGNFESVVEDLEFDIDLALASYAEYQENGNKVLSARFLPVSDRMLERFVDNLAAHRTTHPIVLNPERSLPRPEDDETDRALKEQGYRENQKALAQIQSLLRKRGVPEEALISRPVPPPAAPLSPSEKECGGAKNES